MSQYPYLSTLFSKEIKEIIFEKEDKKLIIREKYLNNDNIGRKNYYIFKFINYRCTFNLNMNNYSDYNFLIQFEKNHNIDSQNYNQKYIEFLFENLKNHFNKEINDRIKNKVLFSDEELFNIMDSKLYYLDSDNLQYLLTLNFIEKNLKEITDIDYVIRNKNENIEYLLSELYKNENTKYIPIVLLFEELKENKWFENKKWEHLFNILMKENYKSYNKLFLLKEMVNNLMLFNENFYTKEEVNALILCKALSRSDKDLIEETVCHINTEIKLNELLELFNYKDVMLLHLYRQNPSFIIENLENQEENVKNFIKGIKDNSSYAELLKLSFLIYFQNIDDNVFYNQLEKIKNKIKNNENATYFFNVYEEIIKQEFYQRIIIKKNIESF